MNRGRSPYDPAKSGPQVHDRRAREINRGSTGHIVEVEVEDPYEAGAKISAVRSVRDDPLADHLARGHIDQAQYEAGREFQKWFAAAERGPRAMQMSEAVDGDPPRETLTDEQMWAGKWLTKCYGALGKDGSILMHEMLIEAKTTRQVAAARGMSGSAWELYFARRLFECLNTLAIAFGFANGDKPLT
jgi:hypothetical protein